MKERRRGEEGENVTHEEKNAHWRTKSRSREKSWKTTGENGRNPVNQVSVPKRTG